MTASPSQIIREDIQAMSAYAVQSSAGMVKLDAMENPYSLPEPLRQEIASLVATSEINRYPDSVASNLKDRLRQTMVIPTGADILLGNGSDEIIQIIIQACARPGAVIMAPTPTFVMYRQYALIAGLKFVGVPLASDFSLDLDRFLAAMREHNPAVVFISYPNNPSGNLFSEKSISQVLVEAPGLVVLDEAYQAFAGATFMSRLSDFPNMIALRTVSKIGLAGLRLGYAAGLSGWIEEFNKVRSPYNVGVLTQLVAEKVLAHNSVIERQAADICAEREKLVMVLKSISGITPFPSVANFILARVPDASQVFEALRQHNILIKNLHGSHPLLDNCLRFTIGTTVENDLLISALRTILGASNHGVEAADRVR